MATNPLVTGIFVAVVAGVVVTLIARHVPRIEAFFRREARLTAAFAGGLLLGGLVGWMLTPSSQDSVETGVLGAPLQIVVDAPAAGATVTSDTVFRGRILAPASPDAIRAQWWMDDGDPSPVRLIAGEWDILWTATGPAREHTFHLLAWDDTDRSVKTQLTFTYRPEP